MLQPALAFRSAAPTASTNEVELTQPSAAAQVHDATSFGQVCRAGSTSLSGLTPPQASEPPAVDAVVNFLRPVERAATALMQAVLRAYAFDPAVLETFRSDAEALVRAWRLTQRTREFLTKLATPAELQALAQSLRDEDNLALRDGMVEVMKAVGLTWPPAPEPAGMPVAADQEMVTQILQRLCPAHVENWQASSAMCNYLRQLVADHLPGDALARANQWMNTPVFTTLLRVESALSLSMANLAELSEATETLARLAATFQVQQYTALLQDDPDDAQALRSRADLLGRVLGQYDHALQDLDAVIDRDATADDYLERAHCQVALGDPQAAEHDAARAVVFDLGSDDIFRTFLGLARDNALTALPAQARLDTSEVLPELCRRGMLMGATGDLAAARSDLAAAQRLGPTDPQVLRLAELMAAYEAPTLAMPPAARVQVAPGAASASTLAVRLAKQLDVLGVLCARMENFLQQEFELLPEVNALWREQLLRHRDEFNEQVVDLLCQLCSNDQLAEMDALLSGPTGATLCQRLLPLGERVRMASHHWLKQVGYRVANVDVGPDLRDTPLRQLLAVLEPDAPADAGGLYGAQCDNMAHQLCAHFSAQELQEVLALAQTPALRHLCAVYRHLTTELFNALQAGPLMQSALELAGAQSAAAEARLKDNPGDVRALAARARARIVLQDGAGAAADLDALLELEPTPHNFRTRACWHMLHQHFQQAASDAQSAVNLAPRDALSFLVRAEVHLAQGHMQKALRDAERAREFAVDASELVQAQAVLSLAYEQVHAPGRRPSRS